MAKEFVVEFDFDEEMGYPNSIKTGFKTEKEAIEWATAHTTTFNVLYQFRVA